MTTAAVVDADGTFGEHATVYFRGTVADCKAYAESRRNVQVLVGCTTPAGSQIFHSELSYMLARKLWKDAFAFAVVPTQGRCDSGDAVRIVETADNLNLARAIASKLTADYQKMMKPHGSSNGGYRVIAWGSMGSTIDGHILDRTPDAR